MLGNVLCAHYFYFSSIVLFFAPPVNSLNSSDVSESCLLNPNLNQIFF